VIFSAHNLYHVEEVCDRVAIMNNGRIVTQGPLGELRERYGTTEYHVFTTVEVPGSAAENGRYHRIAESMEEVETIRTAAETNGGKIDDIRTVEPTLERLFLDLAESEDDTERTEPTEV
jgi:ABC-2 type transport system ATP-binding protein